MLIVDTPNGRQTVNSNEDAVAIIRTYISDELADFISEKLVEFDETEYRNAQEWATDYRAMEMENEEWRNELDEVNSQLQQLSYKADEPGFSKKKVIAEIDKIWQHIQKIL